MKNTILTILLVGTGLLSMAQTIVYEYDNAGNRKLRHVLQMPMARVDTTLNDSIQNPLEEVVDNTNNKDEQTVGTSSTLEPSNDQLTNNTEAKENIGGGTIGEKEGLKDQVGTAEITIFPNPTAGKIRVNINGLEAKEKSWLRLYDINSKLITSQEGLSISNKIDLTKYQPGVFILKIGANGEETEWKIIRE